MDKQSCKYGKDCGKMLSCNFGHTEEQLNSFRLNAKLKSGKEKHRDKSNESKQSKSSQCKYGKNCNNMTNCKFAHSDEQLNSFKLKKTIEENKIKTRGNSGESKSSKSNRCKYGSECKDIKNCKFLHTEKKENSKQNQDQKQRQGQNPFVCEHGKSCSNMLECKKEHSEEDKQYFRSIKGSSNNNGDNNSNNNKKEIRYCKFGLKCNDNLKCKYPHTDEEISQFKKQSKSSNNVNPFIQTEQEEQKEIKQHKEPKESKFIFASNNRNQEDVQEKDKCHWFDIFGKCDLNRCKFNHNFKPNYQCIYIEKGLKCSSKNLPKYTQKSEYKCTLEQKINDCHSYTINGKCNIKICTYLHKDVKGKCPFKQNCKFCKQTNVQKDNEVEVDPIKPEHKKEKEPKFIFASNNLNQEDVQEKDKCHWFDIFGKCDLNRCKFNHNFKPSYQCIQVEKGLKCTNKNLPKYTQKSEYKCTLEQKINDCHSYTINGKCNVKICTYLHKDVKGKCPFKQNCKFCKQTNQSQDEEKKESASKITRSTGPPKIVYFRDEFQMDIPENEKCHWYDITGKCDLNQCTKEHNFLPKYECKYIKEGLTCPRQYPKYILKSSLDCNQKDVRHICHDYNLSGKCKYSLCKHIHKEVTGKCSINGCRFCAELKKYKINQIQQIEQNLKKQYFFKVETFNSRLKEMEQEIHKQIKISKQEETLDLMFIVDCTSSMDRWISFVKTKIKVITDSVRQIYPRYSIRYSFVGYRDFGDAKVANFDFDDDLVKFIDHVNNIKAIGGGDIPEDMASGLKEGLQQKFRSFVKAVFLIYDAPNHGLQYHDGTFSDDHENEGIEKYIEQYARCNTYFTQMMLQSRSGRYIAQKTFDAISAEYEKNNKKDYLNNLKLSGEDDNEVEKWFSLSITTSIKHSKTNSLHEKGHFILNRVLKQIKSNQILFVNPVNLYIRNFDFTIQWNDPFIIEEKSSFTYEIQIQELIDEGASRVAYKAKDITLNNDVVVKFDMRVDPRLDLYKSMKEQQETQVISSYIVSKFRDLVIPYVTSLLSLPYYIQSQIGIFNNDSYCYLETYLESFDKFSNNSDYQKEAKTENEKLLECLPHFSFQYTEGYLIITDLQGHGSILTDPCIHTIDNKKHGNTNLGISGISKYFAKHQCNEFCQKLKLIHPNGQNPQQILTKDYQKEVEEMSRDAIQNIKNVSLIQSYEKKKLFCELCESFDPKNTDFNKDKPKDLRQFVNECCIECNAKNMNTNSQTKASCISCKVEYTNYNFWLKRKKARINGQCPYCNKIDYLLKIQEYYRLKDNDD